MHARLGRKVELVGRFHIKRLVPSVHIAYRAIDAELGWAVGVREHALACGLLMRLITPDLPIAMNRRWSPVKPSSTGASFPLRER